MPLFKIFILFFGCFSSFSSFSSFSYELFELKLAVKADGMSVVEDIQLPTQTQGSTFPINLTATFQNNFSTAGTATWEVKNNTGNALTNIQVLSYIDIEIEEVKNTFFNEAATLSALTLPDNPRVINGYSPQPASQWMVDEPGYSGGGLLGAFNNFSLSNSTAQGLTAEDIAVLFEHNILEVKDGDAFYIEMRIGNSETNGVMQKDVTSNQTYFINSVAYAKRTLIPPIVAITAPTLHSTSNITDTTIRVTDDVSILVADVVVDSSTTASYSNFSCNQTSAIQVDCVITITSTGNLVVRGTDSDNLSDNDSANYGITATVKPSYSPEKVPANGLWVLIILIASIYLIFTHNKMRTKFFSIALAIVLLIILPSHSANAASIDNRGKAFWVSFMKNYNNAGTAKIFVAAADSGKVVVEVAAIDYKEEFGIVGGLVTPIILPDEVMLDGAGLKFSKGIHVTADVDIALYGISQLRYTTDAFQAIPVTKLGTEYYMVGYTKTGGMPPEFAVIATEDDTVVEFEFNELSKLDEQDPVFTQRLNKGDIYYFEYAVTDITGTKIKANKPVSVFSGNNCVNIPTTLSACDHIVEQVPDVTRWGQNFLLSPLALRGKGDTIRVLAQADNTELYVNYSHRYTLAKGEYYEFIADKASYIKTSHPALVMQYSNGATFDNVNADPFMMLVTPVNQYTNDYLIATPSGSFADNVGGKNFVNVIIHQSDKGSLKLDNQAVDVGLFSAINSTEYVYAQLPINDGQHTLTADIAFGASVYGFANYESYGYPGGSTYLDSSITVEPDNCLAHINVRNKPGKVQLIWGNSGAATYRITRSNRYDGTFQSLAENTANQLTYLDKAVSDQSNYFYQVTQFDSLGIARCRSAKTVGYPPNFGRTFNVAPTIVSTPPESAKVRETLTYQMSVSDLENSTLTYELLDAPNTLPAATFSVSGKLSWVPEAPGEYNFALLVTDANGAKALQEFILSVYDPNQPPVVTSAPILSGDSNQRYQYQVVATDPDGDTLHYAINASHSGVKIEENTGLITWQVPAATQGTYPVEVTVTDEHGASVKQKFIIYINKDLPPRFTSVPVLTGTTGVAYRYQTIATDPEGARVKYFLPYGGPEGMIIDVKTGLLTWSQPAAGVYNMTVTATDGVNNTNQTFNLTITDASDETLEITSTPDSSWTAATPYTYQVTVDHAHGTPRYELSVVNDTAPISIDANTGLVTWDYPVLGNYSIKVIVNDGKHIVTQNYQLSVRTSQNTNTLPPEITSTPNMVHKAGVRYSYMISAKDPEGQRLSYSLVNSPADMAISGNRVYWNTPVAGTYPIAIKVSDGTHEVTQSYTLTVIEEQTSNQLPEFTDFPGTTTLEVNQAFSYQIKATDADNDTLTYYFNGYTLPDGMNIDASTGLITWSGGAEVTRYRILVAVSDGKSIVSKQFYLYNRKTNKPPVFNNRPSGNITEGEAWSFDFNATDPEGETVTFFFAGEAPAGMTINATTGLVEWGNATGGRHSFTIVATDGVNQAKLNIAFTVGSSKGTAPRITSAPVTTGQMGIAYRYQVVAGDSDGDALTYVLAQAPSGMTIDTNGLIDWSTPQSGQHTVSIAVSDDFYRVTQGYTLVISTANNNQPPTITSIYPSTVMAGNRYIYQAEATDAEGDNLTYRLANAPAAMTVDSRGLIAWQTLESDVGHYEMILIVSDGQSEVQQTIYLEVKEKVAASEDLKKAVTWLKAQQQTNGSVTSTSTIATPYQATDEAFRAAQLIDDPFLDNEIRVYLNSAEIYTTEHVARQVIYQSESNINYNNDLNAIWSHYTEFAYQSIAGYNDFGEGGVNVLASAYALLAQAQTSKKDEQVAGAIAYLVSQQANDGSFSMANNLADMYVTSVALRALLAYEKTYALGSEIRLARNYLMQNYNSIRDNRESYWKKSHVLLTLYEALPDKSVLATQVAALESRQLNTGSWYNDVFTTALTIQALYQFVQ